MGKRSRERRIGKTYEQRVAKPTKYKSDTSFAEEQKSRKKESFMKKYIAQLMKSGKLSGIKKRVET